MMGAPESHPYPLWCAALSRLWRSFLRARRPALAPLIAWLRPARRGPPGGAVAPRLRRIAPSLRSASAGRVPCPPAFSLGPCAPLSRLRGLSLAPLCFALPSRCGGLPLVGLALLVLGFALRGFLAGSPSAPFLARRLPAGGACGPSALVCAFGPPAFFLRAVLSPGLPRLSGGSFRARASRCSPWRTGGFFAPPRSPPGSARSLSGASPPLWVAFFAPLSQAPRRASPAPGAPFPVRFTIRKL